MEQKIENTKELEVEIKPLENNQSYEGQEIKLVDSQGNQLRLTLIY